MARNEQLENKVHEALAGTPDVAEKQMFRGTAFMVAEKLCISAGDEELMFRIDPAWHDTVLEEYNCREMLRNGKAIKGYVYVHQAQLKKKSDFDYWIGLALDYNKKAKPSKKKVTR